MAESQQTFTFRVPLNLDLDARIDIAQEVIEFIVQRTNKGLDKDNKPFKGYSESYMNSIDFKIANKDKTVDLQLSGDMLSELKVINTAVNGFITIGYEPNTEENDRAAWQRNNTRPTFPKRDFLGIADKDLDRIIKNYVRSNPVEIQARRATSQIASSLVSNFLGGILDES